MWSLIKHKWAIYRNKVKKINYKNKVQEEKRESESKNSPFGNKPNRNRGGVGGTMYKVNGFNCHSKFLKSEEKKCRLQLGGALKP